MQSFINANVIPRKGGNFLASKLKHSTAAKMNTPEILKLSYHARIVNKINVEIDYFL